jgi:hypothetical protein
MSDVLTEVKKGSVVVFTYTNYRGEKANRKAIVKGLFWGTSLYHKGPQLFMRGLDLDKMQYRDYAACDVENLIVVEYICDWEYED